MIIIWLCWYVTAVQVITSRMLTYNLFHSRFFTWSATCFGYFILPSLGLSAVCTNCEFTPNWSYSYQWWFQIIMYLIILFFRFWIVFWDDHVFTDHHIVLFINSGVLRWLSIFVFFKCWVVSWNDSVLQITTQCHESQIFVTFALSHALSK